MRLTPKIKFIAFAVILVVVGFSSELYAAEVVNYSSSFIFLSKIIYKNNKENIYEEVVFNFN